MFEFFNKLGILARRVRIKMKEILIRLDGKSYAIESSCIVEIVPVVQMEPLPEQNPFLAGGILYHGSLLPVVDLCELLLGRPHQKKFSTRILIVEVESQKMGLIAESLTDLDLAANVSDVERLDLKVLKAQCS